VIGRDPYGTLPSADFEVTAKRLVSDLQLATTPEGRRYFGRVFLARDIAPRLADVPATPDIFYEPGVGLGVAMEGTRSIRASGRKSGEHRADGIVVRADGGPLPQAIWEVPHLITDLAGIDPDAWRVPWGSPPPSSLTTDEEESIAEHLRDLGYVD
jgi:hypothetical protein